MVLVVDVEVLVVLVEVDVLDVVVGAACSAFEVEHAGATTTIAARQRRSRRAAVTADKYERRGGCPCVHPR